MNDAPQWWDTRRFAALAMIAAMVPLLLPAIPPLTDLPGHMGRYRVMLGGDPVLQRWYRFEWHLVGNLGVDLLVRALAPLIGLEPAVKLVVTMIPPLTIAGLLWIAREIHGRAPAYALFALPLSYNFPFQFGFVNFSLGMALALLAFALWVRLGRLQRTRLRAVLFVPVSVGVWTCHIVGWGTLGLLVLASELIVARDEGRRWAAAIGHGALRGLPLALPFVFVLAWRSANGGGESGGWGLLDYKISWLAMVLRDRWMPIDVAATAVLYTILYKAARDPRVGISRRLAMATGVMFATFLIMPRVLFGSAYADMRLAPYLVAIALIAVRPGARVPHAELNRLALAAVALFAARMIGHTASYAAYDAGFRQELAMLDHLPRGVRLLTLVGSTCDDPWQRRRLEHLAGIALVRRSAFANDQWQMSAAPLLSVVGGTVPGWTNDPSQVVTTAACPRDPNIRPVAAALAGFPRARFDYLWLVRPPPFAPQLVGDMKMVWHGQAGSALYRIDQAAPRGAIGSSRKALSSGPLAH